MECRSRQATFPPGLMHLFQGVTALVRLQEMGFAAWVEQAENVSLAIIHP